MKEQIITGIAIIACVVLCAIVWPRSVKVGDLPAELIKTVVISEIAQGRKKDRKFLFLQKLMTLNLKLSQKVNQREPT